MNDKQFEEEIALLKQRVERLESLLSLFVSNGFVPKNEIKEKASESQNQKLSNRDKTKYLYEGKILPKNRLVLAIIKDYTTKHSQINLKDLQSIFDKSLQGSLMVVGNLENIKKITDYQKRYFSNEQDLITLKDGTIVAVCNQWGIFNIKKFIMVANNLGYKIEEI